MSGTKEVTLKMKHRRPSGQRGRRNAHGSVNELKTDRRTAWTDSPDWSRPRLCWCCTEENYKMGSAKRRKRLPVQPMAYLEAEDAEDAEEV